MSNTPVIAQTSAQQGFLPPGPGLYGAQFDVQGRGLDEGYLDGAQPLEGQDLDNFMQQLVAGITQLNPRHVFPRWQPEPPVLPKADVNWASIGVTEQDLLPGYPYIEHDGANDGRSIMRQYEEFTLLCSFYGPQADLYDALLRDGLRIAQNREVLQLNSMGYISFYRKTVVPQLIKNTWLRRVDRSLRFSRAVLREYPILNLLGASIAITAQRPNGGILTANDTIVVPDDQIHKIYVDFNNGIVTGAYELPANSDAVSPGPITVALGSSLTIPIGSSLRIL